jgi:hypothetical protein
MNALILVNYSQPKELEMVKNLAHQLGPNLCVATMQPLDFTPTWIFDSMEKKDVEWTKRLLRRFIESESTFDVLIKIDPDTQITKLPLPEFPENADVAGDFRKAPAGWVWFGACQYFSKSAISQLLADKYYSGMVRFQDVALAQSIARLGLKAVNMLEIDGWALTPSTSQIVHPGCTRIKRIPAGSVTF